MKGRNAYWNARPNAKWGMRNNTSLGRSSKCGMPNAECGISDNDVRRYESTKVPFKCGMRNRPNAEWTSKPKGRRRDNSNAECEVRNANETARNGEPASGSEGPPARRGERRNGETEKRSLGEPSFSGIGEMAKRGKGAYTTCYQRSAKGNTKSANGRRACST